MRLDLVVHPLFDLGFGLKFTCPTSTHSIFRRDRGLPLQHLNRTFLSLNPIFFQSDRKYHYKHGHSTIP